MRTAYVYLIGPAEGPYKIGHATSVRTRLGSLQCGNWQELFIHHTVTIQANLAPVVEAELHDKFAADRIRGEWFDVDLTRAKESLEIMAAAYAILRENSDRFTPRSCYHLTKDPMSAYQCVSYYKNRMNQHDGKAEIEHLNAAILRRAGQAALLIFTTVFVQGKDVRGTLCRNPGMARQAERSLVQAMNALVDIRAEGLARRLDRNLGTAA